MSLAALKPAHLRQMMNLAKQSPVSFAFGEDARGADKLALDDRLAPRELAARFRTETGCAKPSFGTCRAESGALVFNPEKPLKDLRARYTGLAKAEGYALRQAKVAHADERGLELEAEPREGAPAVAPEPALGRNDDTPEDVRPAEVISGASGVQYTSGEVTNRTAAEGGDFAAGTRANAEENDHRGVGSPYDGGTNPMQSVNLGGDFAVRHGLGLLCVNYRAKGYHSLEDIADYNRPNSGYLRAFTGLAHSRQHEDPAAADILRLIPEAVAALARLVPAGRQGELVVSFQGHGVNGAIVGVDGGLIPAASLLALARAAAKSRVSITYVLDGCFTGNAVADFQADAADVVERRADKAGAPAAVREAVKSVLAFGRELVNFSRATGANGLEMAKAVARVRGRNDDAAWQRIADLNADLAAKVASMRAQWEANRTPAQSLNLDPAAVDTVLAEIAGELAARGPGMSFDPEAWVAAIGRFQDRVSDAANDLIRAAAALVKRG